MVAPLVEHSITKDIFDKLWFDAASLWNFAQTLLYSGTTPFNLINWYNIQYVSMLLVFCLRVLYH